MVLPAWRLLREAVLPKGISQGADRQQEGSDLLWHPHFLEPPVQLLEDWPPEWRHGRLFEVRRSCPVSLGNEERLESCGSPSLRSMRGQRFLLCARATQWPGWKGGASQGISECFQLEILRHVKWFYLWTIRWNIWKTYVKRETTANIALSLNFFSLGFAHPREPPRETK